MKRFLPFVVFLAVTGCAKSGVPAAVALPMEAPVLMPAAPALAAAAPALAKPVPSLTIHAGTPSPTLATALVFPDVPPPTAAEADADDPPMIAAFMDSASSDGSYHVDDRTPYGVVVSEFSAHTATIAWRTEVPTTGLIEYGRTWGFTANGYTHRFVDEVAKTDHIITLTDLRRFTGYVFKVTAVTPLGLKFPEQERKLRTKFWSWR